MRNFHGEKCAVKSFPTLFEVAGRSKRNKKQRVFFGRNRREWKKRESVTKVCGSEGRIFLRSEAGKKRKIKCACVIEEEGVALGIILL